MECFLNITNFNILCLILIVFLLKVYGDFRKYRFVKNFESYMITLNYFMEKAYDMIHKDKILIYSIEALKIDDEQFNQISKDFASLTINFIGPVMQKEFSDFFGNEETFLFNIMEFFNTKYEGDEIRKTSVSEMMEEDKDI